MNLEFQAISRRLLAAQNRIKPIAHLRILLRIRLVNYGSRSIEDQEAYCYRPRPRVLDYTGRHGPQVWPPQEILLEAGCLWGWLQGH